LSVILSSWTFLSDRSFVELCGLFWFVILLDIPRYSLGFLAVFITGSVTRRAQSPIIWPGTASILIAGHNEAESFERCVRSLRQQTRKNVEIICVDDGSTDGTREILRRLSRLGLIDIAVSVKDRGGKSAALNLAASLAKGDALVVVDCDCTFEAHAIERLLAPLNNKAVGAVAAAVLVRNASNSVIASLQGLEYLFSIYLGRTLQDYFGLVTCVSGAMGAFRRSAWFQVGGMDVGPGEDLDITFRLRQQGYAIRFVGNAICWTDVPETLERLLRQRRRWERDAVRLRLRKFGYSLNPFDARFRLREAVHQLEFLLYSVAAALVFFLYIADLATEAPDLLPIVLFSTGLILVVLDAATLIMAAILLRRGDYLRLLPFVPLFTPLQFLVMRNARVFTFVEELLFSTSRHDDFVPLKVRRQVPLD
jgi:cellulose synthase/poly-beta-1,6-N-acetylglucosamine synthase-like glycosyltransferase